MADPDPNSRWHQYSLRTLLIVVTLFAVGISWFQQALPNCRIER